MRWTWVLLDWIEKNRRSTRDGDLESSRAERNRVFLSLRGDDWKNAAESSETVD